MTLNDEHSSEWEGAVVANSRFLPPGGRQLVGIRHSRLLQCWNDVEKGLMNRWGRRDNAAAADILSAPGSTLAKVCAIIVQHKKERFTVTTLIVTLDCQLPRDILLAVSRAGTRRDLPCAHLDDKW